MTTYRFLCWDRGVLLGPYLDGEIQAWLRGIQTMREVHGIDQPIAVRAATRAQAERILKAGVK